MAILGVLGGLGTLIASAYLDPLLRHGFAYRDTENIDWDPAIGYVPALNMASHKVNGRKGLDYMMYSDSRRARVSQGEQTADAVDILAIGGSFTEGHGVENEKTFTFLLGEEFDADVANFGLGGYGGVASLIMLKRNLDLKPKVVIYTLIRDHLRRNLSPCKPARTPFCLPQAYMDLSGPGIRPPHEEYRQEDTAIRYWRDMKNGTLGLYWKARFALGIDYLKANVTYPNDSAARNEAMAFVLERMIAMTRQIGARLVVVFVPHLRPGKRGTAPAVLVNDGLTFVDLTAPLNRHYQAADAPLLRFEKDGHPNALGHAFIARQIAEVLRPLL